MRKTIDFYVDFISPFAYLAQQALPSIAKKHEFEVSYHIVNLAELKRLAGNTGPTNRQIPLKLRYLQFDKARWAKRYSVPIKNPANIDPARLNQASFYALDRGRIAAYASHAWHLTWGEGREMNAQSVITDVAKHLGLDANEMLAFSDSPAARKRYDDSTKEAHERGVFGVPTMMVGEEMWWGNDRLEFLDEYLARGENA